MDVGTTWKRQVLEGRVGNSWNLDLFHSIRECDNVRTVDFVLNIVSDGGYGINTQVEKSKNMTIVNFMECDLNQLFWIFVSSWMWYIWQSVCNIAFNTMWHCYSATLGWSATNSKHSSYCNYIFSNAISIIN